MFERLASELADILRVDVGFIAVFADESRAEMRMLAFCLDGRMRPSFSYPLHGHAVRAGGRPPVPLPAGGRAAASFRTTICFRKLGLDSYAAYPLSNAAGQPLGLIGAMHRSRLDNVALCEAILKIFGVRAVAEIERSEEQYRAIFNAAADSMVLRDADFRVVDVNPAYEAMSGRKRDEVLGARRCSP